MLTPAQAAEHIAAAMPRFETTAVPLAEAHGRVLRQPVAAERDQPPFDRVMMDGIALRHATWSAGQRSSRRT